MRDIISEIVAMREWRDNGGNIPRESARDKGVTALLMELQGGICFDCDNAPATEFAHVSTGEGKAAPTGRRGVSHSVMGGMACRDCNNRHKELCALLGTGADLPLRYLIQNGRAGRLHSLAGFDRPTLVAAGTTREATSVQAAREFARAWLQQNTL